MTRRLALVLAGSAATALVAMVVVAVVTGATQETFEYVAPPTLYAPALRANATGVRLIFAFDVAFIVLYTAFFAALADMLRKLGRPFVTLALVAMIGTAVLDIVENHHILSLLGAAEHDLPIEPDALILQQTISSTKFSISYIALFMFGLAIPRTTKLGWLLCLFLTAGTLAAGVAGFAAPPAWRPVLDSVRWIGFLIGFVLAALWLRQAPEPSAPAG